MYYHKFLAYSFTQSNLLPPSSHKKIPQASGILGQSFHQFLGRRYYFRKKNVTADFTAELYILFRLKRIDDHVLAMRESDLKRGVHAHIAFFVVDIANVRLANAVKVFVHKSWNLLAI